MSESLEGREPGAEATAERPAPSTRKNALIAVLAALGALVAVIVGMRIANAPTPLERAAEKCELAALLVVADDGKTLRLNVSGKDGYQVGDVKIDDVVCVLKDLNAPEAVLSHIDSTRALDGQQTDQWDKIAARWTYHPDSGLRMILTTR